MSGLGSIAKESVPPSGLEPYLNGTKLYGDDFLGEALEGWFADEREGYASIDARGGGHGEKYLSHTKNIRYGFRYLPDIAFPRVLGFGAADAREIEPVLDRVQTVTVVEPGLAFRTSSFKGVPLEYVVPNPDGTLPLASDEFDLATCFGVLHHLARVSQSVKELHRCIRPGG